MHLEKGKGGKFLTFRIQNEDKWAPVAGPAGIALRLARNKGPGLVQL
jgi:hypothetical protein